MEEVAPWGPGPSGTCWAIRLVKTVQRAVLLVMHTLDDSSKSSWSKRAFISFTCLVSRVATASRRFSSMSSTVTSGAMIPPTFSAARVRTATRTGDEIRDERCDEPCRQAEPRGRLGTRVDPNGCLMVQCRCLTRAFTFFPPPPHLQKTSVQGLRSIEVVVRGSAVACCVWLAGVVRVG